MVQIDRYNLRAVKINDTFTKEKMIINEVIYD